MRDNYVPASGPKTAKIAIVGNCPTAGDKQMGKAFSSGDGDQLTTFLSMAGIPKSSCYLTYLDHNYPPGGSFKKRYCRKKEYTSVFYELATNLGKELEKVKPNVIVAIGNDVLYALTGKQGVTSWRGSILNSQYGKVIPVVEMKTARNAFYSKESKVRKYFPLTLFDFSRVLEESKFPEIRIPPYELITNPTLAEVEDAFQKLMQCKSVAFDIETLNGTEIDMVSFCGDPSWSICVPLCHSSGVPYWDLHSETRVWQLISKFLSSEKVGKIAQNANFDILFMERMGFKVKNLYMDTMNAHHCCYPNLPKGLDTITSLYTKLPYFKDQSTERRQEYNALDSLATKRASISIDKELRDFGMFDFYHGYAKKLTEYYRDVANRGVKFQADKRDELQKELQPEYDKLEMRLTDVVGQEIAQRLDSDSKTSQNRKAELLERYGKEYPYLVNPRSPDQLKKLFYEELNYYTYKKGGKPTTNDDSLTKMIRRYDSQEAKLVKKLRTVGKELNTYVKMKIDPDDRVRTTYLVSGTNTGRLASRKTPFGTGANLQNIPKSPFRRLFVPDYDDYIFIEGDLAGADAMIVAYESQDPGLIHVFESGADYHSTNAKNIFGLDVPNPHHVNKGDVPKDKRRTAKTIGHAANYGTSAFTVSMILEIPKGEAQELLNAYYRAYPGIKAWHREIQQELRADRTLETCFGRKCQFFGAWGDSLFHEAYSYKPQSTVGDIIHTGFIQLYERLPEWAWVSLNVHDSLVVQCPKREKDNIVKLMKECMEIPITIKGKEITVPVDFEWGENWYDFKEV